MNANGEWALVTPLPIVLGTTALVFSKQLVRANVRDFGARGNGGGHVYDGSINFGSTDADERLGRFHRPPASPAGTPSGLPGPERGGATLITTATYATSTTVTLATAASTTVSGAAIVWGTGRLRRRSPRHRGAERRWGRRVVPRAFMSSEAPPRGVERIQRPGSRSRRARCSPSSVRPSPSTGASPGTRLNRFFGGVVAEAAP